MAQYLRARQAGIGNDLSAGLKPELFMLEQVARYGINSQISTLAYDPVQSLLAAGTNDSQFGHGQIYVFGQKRVAVVLKSRRPASIKTLQFCAQRLISVDVKNDVNVFDLNTKQLEHSFSPPGRIASITCDPALDYVFIALQSGDIIAYDMDRGQLAALRIPNLWRAFNPRSNIASIVSLSLHPRDIGTLLIGYSHGAAIYSFKQNKATSFLVYELAPGTLGGYSDPSMASRVRTPKLVDALWHPTGTFVLTAHEDGSLVFWDPKTGKVVQARTIETPNVNQPGGATNRTTSATFAIRNPFVKIAWCAKQNPDDTGLLIAGGTSSSATARGPTFIDLGATPIYATSSWQILAEHFEKPKSRATLAIPPNTDIVDFCLIPRASPHFAGAQDPVAIIGILNSGELTVMSFPSGYPISPTNQLHPSLSFIAPFIESTALASVHRSRWLGMEERRNRGPLLIKGGAGGKRPSMRFEDRMILQTAHADAVIRLWDIGHADDIENEEMIQVDVARAVGRSDDIHAGCMSLSGNTGELAVGLGSGELVMFRWGTNSSKGDSREPAEILGLFDISSRVEPDLRAGFLPLRMLAGRAPVTVVQQSEIGFVAAGFKDGKLAVIDLRGPAVIFTEGVDSFTGPTKKSTVRRTSERSNQIRQEYATTIEFGILALEDEGYSSILLFIGTNIGRIITLKLLPDRTGAYTVQLAGIAALEDRVIMIAPLDPESGASTVATQEAMAGLRTGSRINGVLLAVTVTGIRIFKPATAKGASKTFNEVFCDSACVVTNIDGAIGLVGLFGDGTAKTYSIPGLKEIASTRLDRLTDARRFVDALIAPTGEIIAWIGPSEIIILDAWGSGRDETISNDILINPELIIPPRPTISNIQWISGTQHFTASDLDLLVGGPNRPPSKRMLEQQKADARAAQQAGRAGDPSSSSSGGYAVAGGAQDTYWNQMTKQITERTNNINIMGDSMNRLEESSAGFADSVSKMIADQKKQLAMGFFKGKLGL